MNERIMRTGREKEVELGCGVLKVVEEYDIYSADMRTTLNTVWGLDTAQQILRDYVLQERTACSTGSCED